MTHKPPSHERSTGSQATGSRAADDDALIDAALAGNSAAFGQLVEKYQDRLWHTLSYALGSPEDAADVVQETFVQAFLKLETFQRTAAFYTWLYRIAFNMAASHRRRRKKTMSIQHMHETSADEPVAHGTAPEAPLEERERVELVQNALAALTEEHRSILVLRELEGCDYEMIGELLELPVGTVRSRLHRARLQLRDQLKLVLQEDVP